MGGTLRPEAQLVVYCSRTSGVPREKVTELADSAIDWDEVADLAVGHGVASLVYDSLSDCCADRVPEDVMSRLQRRSELLAQRNLRLMQEVGELVELFERHDVPAIPYRGPVVAEVAYDNVGAREFGDLDFLVRRGDIPTIQSLLLERGYEQEFLFDSTEDLSPAQEWAYVRLERDYPFRDPDESIEVELHWRIVSRRFPTSIGLDTVWDRRDVVSVAGRDVPVLSTEDRVLVLCVHGTRHRWEQLRWICDVAELLDRHAVDFDAVLERARAHDCERMLLVGLAVVDRLFDVPLPRRVEDAIVSDSAIEPLTDDVVDRLFVPAGPPGFDMRLFQSRTIEGYVDTFRFWINWLFKPTRRDVEHVRLPWPLLPLYVVVRLAKLARGTFSNALSPPNRDR